MLGESASIPLDEESPLTMHDGRNVVVGLRPEDIVHAEGGVVEGKIAVPATVAAIEELGAEHVAHLRIDAYRIDSGDPDAIEDIGGESNVVARFAPSSTARAGDRIELAIDSGKLHFFDADTHASLSR